MFGSTDQVRKGESLCKTKYFERLLLTLPCWKFGSFLFFFTALFKEDNLFARDLGNFLHATIQKNHLDAQTERPFS